ncbi:hypothetical protein SASPL_140244 [Salvia splendens]|uniref:Uncharacterized protein n=1 Tax=Salvia splendens TaxID=180675 RepID=A0A8X8ZCB1_SALSN|nr:hypothetical protein SASPL_140244 [Salvia splendens]
MALIPLLGFALPKFDNKRAAFHLEVHVLKYHVYRKSNHIFRIGVYRYIYGSNGELQYTQSVVCKDGTDFPQSQSTQLMLTSCGLEATQDSKHT